MIAGISHDLRTPLTAIRGSIKGILDGVVRGEQQNKFLQMAYRRTEEMNKLLTQLFELSKLETGRLRFTCEIGKQKQRQPEQHVRTVFFYDN